MQVLWIMNGNANGVRIKGTYYNMDQYYAQTLHYSPQLTSSIYNMYIFRLPHSNIAHCIYTRIQNAFRSKTMTSLFDIQ